MIVSSRLFSSRLNFAVAIAIQLLPTLSLHVLARVTTNNRAIVHNNLLEEITRALNRAAGSCRFLLARNANSRGREPATARPHVRSSRGKRSSTWTGGGGREERIKRWWNGEKRIPWRRGIIFGDVIRDSWKRRGPLIAIAAEKRRERTARGGPGHRSIGRNCA